MNTCGMSSFLYNISAMLTISLLVLLFTEELFATKNTAFALEIRYPHSLAGIMYPARSAMLCNALTVAPQKLSLSAALNMPSIMMIKFNVFVVYDRIELPLSIAT